LPKRLRSADTAARERFVDDLWAKTYPKVKDHEDAIWEHIESNPLYDDPDDPEDPEERDYHSGGHYRNYGQQYVHLGRLPIVPNHLEDDLRALWRTMFVSYPPVQRIEYFHIIRSIMLHWRSDTMVQKTGFSVEHLQGRTWDGGLGFWPEQMYLNAVNNGSIRRRYGC
jgi:hypothetical protein